MPSFSRQFLLATVLGASLALSGCSLFSSKAHVKNGELFETGNARYDAYFRQVHELQTSAGTWNDERRASCKSLGEALKVPSDAADVTLIQMTYEQMLNHKEVGATRLDVLGENVSLVAAYPGKATEPARTLFRAIERCAHSELLRAKTLKQVPTHADELAHSGSELEPHIREDFAKEGGRVPTDVRNELRASLEILGSFGKRAQLSAREAEDFVFDLQRAVKGDVDRRDARRPKKMDRPKGDDTGTPKSDTPKADPPKPKPKPAATSTSSSDPKPATEKPKPKPKPTESGDVFNP